jgi:hypothetical protein
LFLFIFGGCILGAGVWWRFSKFKIETDAIF